MVSFFFGNTWGHVLGNSISSISHSTPISSCISCTQSDSSLSNLPEMISESFRRLQRWIAASLTRGARTDYEHSTTLPAETVDEYVMVRVNRAVTRCTKVEWFRRGSGDHWAGILVRHRLQIRPRDRRIVSLCVGISGWLRCTCRKRAVNYPLLITSFPALSRVSS